ncbi:hypothetical protein IAR50_002117 [Cryptococcus sp. DSM 104548]
METTHTKAGQKRASSAAVTPVQASPQEPLISWKHDQGLRRAVMQATENESIALPSPTQAPRPISSAFSSSSLSSDGGSASRPRKRVCRSKRSLPPCLRTNLASSSSSHSLVDSAPGTAGSSSSGSIPGTKTQLDLLLEQFKLQASPLKPQTVHKSTSRSSRGKEKENAIERNKESGRSALAIRSRSGGFWEDMGSDSSRSRSSGVSAKPLLQDGSSSSSILSTGTNASMTDISSGPDEKSSNARPSAPRPPLSPAKRGLVPRIGLGSQSSRSKPSGLPVQMSSSKPFKTPFLEPRKGLRSSPRRTATAPALGASKPSASSVRAPGVSSPRSAPSKRSAQSLPPQHTSVGSSTRPQPPAQDGGGFTNFDVGENEPDGDRSFDSMDGFFDEMGPEVEMLLKQC